ncbi:hypothetical protein BYT27DRAFT_7134272 [Phlegmacium glaucopus]|nr:hypothetical protein BYT27DRAFT_7134272 [Phlegmacium glaucopus]
MYRNVILPQSTLAMPPRIPPPSHRHGTPSGPWPFIDIDDEITNSDDGSTRIPEPPFPAGPCRHSKRSLQEICWCRYPQSLFPNWTPRQQKKSRITKIIERLGESSLFYLDIMQDGEFVNAGVRQVSTRSQDLHWAAIQEERDPGVRARAIFVENLTGPVLRMLGTRYNIEPFFFSSSIGWIPSRYQSNVVPDRGDHITITLVFIRPIQNPTTVPPSPSSTYTPSIASRAAPDLMIDTQSPLLLRSSDLILVTELLALHVVRSPDSSTIISYHPTAEHRATPAADMHARMHSMGRSVYWSRMFKEERDPTLVVLGLLWYAIYAWDEALETLYAHICSLESRILVKNDIFLTQELHLIRAHLLHYESFLRDFQKTILFVQDTPFPCLQSPEMYTEEERLRSEGVMKRECGNLLGELKRLGDIREKYDGRVKNVMKLGFSIVNNQDSRRRYQLTEATVQDSGAMKQISYLTMVFFPASFAATVFGMNVTVLNPTSTATLGQYCGLVVPLTMLTIWIVIALEIDIKQVRVHRTSRTNWRKVASSTKRQSKLGQPAVGKGGDKLDDDEVGSEDESVDLVEVRYSYNHYRYKNHVTAKEGEKETVRDLDIWGRLGWPVILLSLTFDERWRRRREGNLKVRMERMGRNTKKH